MYHDNYPPGVSSSDFDSKDYIEPETIGHGLAVMHDALVEIYQEEAICRSFPEGLKFFRTLTSLWQALEKAEKAFKITENALACEEMEKEDNPYD